MIDMSFEFRQTFDGTQPEVGSQEQKEVALEFNTFIDDVILNHIDRVSGSSANAIFGTSLYLGVRLDEASDALVTIDLNDTPKSPHTHKQIKLREVSARGDTGDVVIYRLGTDGIVRRDDSNMVKQLEEDRIMTANLPRINILAIDETEPEVAAEFGKTMAANIREFKENRKLEEFMGLLNQPIGMGELFALRDFIDLGSPDTLF